MPAETPRQRRAAGAALSARRGGVPTSRLGEASRSMARSMSKAELRRMASKPRTTSEASGLSHKKGVKRAKTHKGRSRK